MGQLSRRRSIVALNLSQESCVKPTDFVASFFVEILPDIKALSKEDDAPVFKDAIELCQLINKRIKKHNYSRNALISLIKAEFLESRQISDLRGLVGETPFCMFPDELEQSMLFKSVSNNPPALRSNYGDEEYIPCPANEKTQSSRILPEDSVTLTTRIASTTKAKPLNEVGRINQELETLYSNILKDHQWPQYEWQLSLSLSEYEIIRSRIAQLGFIPSAAHLSLNAQRILAVYIAEFYKREYTGSGLNAMTSIDKEWKRNLIDNESLTIPLYKKSNNAQLYSLYVNGGLPIHYIMTQLTSDNNNSALVRFLKGLADEDEIERELAFVSLPATARDILSNTALRESIANQGSIYKQIEQLDKESSIFNADDLNDPGQPFGSFVRFFKEARIEVEKNKTKVSYEAWLDQSSGFMSIRPFIRFSSKKDEEQNFSISTERLALWGVPISEMPDSVILSFEKNGCPVKVSDIYGNPNEQICFVRSSNGEFVEFAGRSCFSLSPIRSSDLDFGWENILLSNYGVQYSDNTGHSFDVKDRILPYNKAPYLLLYSDDGISWSSFKGNGTYKSAAVLFNIPECQPCLGGFTQLSPEVGWVQFEHSINMRVKGKEKKLYNGVGRVYSKPIYRCLHSIQKKGQIIISDDGLLEYELNGEIKHVFLINSGHVQFELFKTDNSEQIKTTLYVDELVDGMVNPETASPEVEPGFHTFRVTFDHRHYSIVDCFALPENASVTIDNRQHLVQFQSVGMDIRCLDSSPSIRMSNNRCSVTEITEESDCLHFSLGDSKGGFLRIETYYPFDQTIFKTSDNIYIKACGRGKNALPAVFNSRCEMVSVSSSNRLTREYVDEHACKIYTYILATNLDVVQASGEKGTKSGNVNFVAYSQDFQPRERQYMVIKGKNVEESISYYHFCFFDLETNQVFQVDPLLSRPERGDSYEAIINLESFENKGILFQSLTQTECAPRYFRPIFVPKKGWKNQMPHTDVRKSNKRNTIKKLSADKAFCKEAGLYAFETAVKHSLYFSTFDVLLSLISESEIDTGNDIARRLALFLKAYLEHCLRQGYQPDYRALWRLSEEFVFDWLMIPKIIYQDVKIPVEDLLVLFKHRPNILGDDKKAYDAFLARYPEFHSSLSNRSRKAAESVYSSIIGPNSMFLGDNKTCLYEKRGRILDKMRKERFIDIICKLQ